MRVTIDEHSRLVHVSKGAALLTLALPRGLAPDELRAAAEAIRAGLEQARMMVVNGQPVRL
jgi:hypothetical protein